MKDKIKIISKENISKESDFISKNIYNQFNNDSNLLVIVGKKGTGKTTLLVKFIKFIKEKNILFLSLDTNVSILKKKFKEYLNEPIDKDNFFIESQQCSIDDLINKINNYNIDYILIDYLELLMESNNKEVVLEKLEKLKEQNKKILLVSLLKDNSDIDENIKNISDFIYHIN